MFAYTFEDVLKQAAQRKWAIFPLDSEKAAAIPSKSLRALIEGMEAPEVLTNGSLEVKAGRRGFRLAPRVTAHELEKLRAENEAPAKKAASKGERLAKRLEEAKQSLRRCYALGNPFVRCYERRERLTAYDYQRYKADSKTLGREVAKRYGREPSEVEKEALVREINQGRKRWLCLSNAWLPWSPDVEGYHARRKEFLSAESKEERDALRAEIGNLQEMVRLENERAERRGLRLRKEVAL